MATIFTSHHSIISTVLWDPHTDPNKTFLSFFFPLTLTSFFASPFLFFSFFPFVFLCLPWTFLYFSFGLFLAKQSKNLHINLARIASIDNPHRLKVSHLNWRGLFIAKPNRIIYIYICSLSCIDRWTGFETTCSLMVVDGFPQWPLIGGFGGAMGLWCCYWSVADGFEFAFLFLFLMIEKSRFFFFFGDCLNWKVFGYCLNWKVCFLILEGWRRWWVWADGGMVYQKKCNQIQKPNVRERERE